MMVIAVMLTDRIFAIFLFSVIFSKAEEINNHTNFQEIGSELYDQEKFCCVIGNSSFHSFDSTIRNFTNNTVIDIIESNIVLRSIVNIENIENIAIIGHGNPTVNCISIGVINFISCKNVIIKGINWKGCGSSNESSSHPVISFYNSSNLTIQSCSFNSSAGPAVVFLEASGSVFINNSVFMHNNQHKGHGVVVQYTPEVTGHTQTKLVINSCNFSYNGVAKSVIFIGGTGNRELQYSCLQNSVFIGNKGVPVYLLHHKLYIRGNMVFRQNTAIGGGGIFSSSSIVVFKNKSNIMFYNNSANTNGGTIFLNDSRLYFTGNSVVDFTNNIATSNGGAIFSISNSATLFGGNTMVVFKSNAAGTSGGALYFGKSSMLFSENSMVAFNHNTATFGGAVYCRSYSEMSFNGNTSVTFTSNGVSRNGGAFNSYGQCSITFDGKSIVTFSNNRAKNGGVIHSRSYSNISFCGSAMVIFTGNHASENGGALRSSESCNIVFDGNSEVTFYDNGAKHGGAVRSERYSQISFDGNTSVTHKGNSASENGGAVDSYENCYIIFDGNSNVTFSNNKGNYGGVMRSKSHSDILFGANTTVTFSNNKARHGGAVYSEQSEMFFYGNASVTYKGNYASENGGAVESNKHCNIIFDGNSKVTFSNNEAKRGGGVHFRSYSDIVVYGNSLVIYDSNSASEIGGALYSYDNCNIKFDGNSIAILSNNKAKYGGVVNFKSYSNITHGGNTSVTYNINEASISGGAIYFNKCVIKFCDNSSVAFTDNYVSSGGAVYSTTYSDVLFDGNSTVKFSGNEAKFAGGAVYCQSYSEMLFDGNTTVMYEHNGAMSGGAMYCKQHSRLHFEGDVKVNFRGNVAKDGGAVNVQQSYMKFTMRSSTRFDYNSARRNGAAIYLDDNFTMTFEIESNVLFNQNNATQYGGAVYGKLKQANQSKILSNATRTNVEFISNNALVGDDVYMHVQASCEMCLNSSIVGLNVTHNNPLHHLALYNPATCINTKNTTNYCDTYLVNNIMLGQNIKINACVLSFHDQPAGGANFVVSGKTQHHKLDETQFVPIACNLFEGISVTGKEVSDNTNFSVTITSYTNSDLEISVQLILELSPCHLGFVFDNTTEKCVCYKESDIVSCSGSTSTIKRGYWFGLVGDQSTVTVCPNNYCNFTCCEATNGFYQLSPVRMNQCSSHRSGTACGSCEEGYTLPFDSVECVSIEKCTAGQTVLVIMLSVIYWIVLVIVVFIMTYYHVEIGYLYAITYYYSILEILLGQHLYASQTLFTVVSIMSSIARVTPKFLGQLCLIKHITAIDKEFIHYSHPLAVTIIVGIICFVTRMSYKLSAFLSRGIIRVICFLLLLSYTSLATTSLLLLRSLTFHNVDKVYTYLSPDIEYFHGRHLPYVIVAVVCTLVIVIGLPLLLLLEPFLNCKINFTKFKPLLDQFQGCYRDRYRSFAAYYMICRLVIILLITVNSPNDNTPQLLLLTTNILVVLMHIIVKPYESKILNVFDGAVLQIMVFISVISLFDSFALSILTILLVMSPLIAFIIMELIIYRESVTRIIMCFKPKSDANIEVPESDIGIAMYIDDNMRRNATIIDIFSQTYFETDDDFTHYRDSFLEVMNDIED